MINRKDKIFYSVKRTRRVKTIAIRVEHDGKVNVLVPRFVKNMYVKQFVRKKTDWILKRQKYFQDLLHKYPPKEFVNGESFPLLGRNYRLKLIRRKGLAQPRFGINCGRLQVTVNGQIGDSLRGVVKDVIKRWYSKYTEKKVQERVKKYSGILDVSPKKVKVVNQLKRWGSCSRNGVLRFNWKLSMLPVSMLDYVVVHELCHLKEHNHSKHFWSLLKSVLPDYETKREYLCSEGLKYYF